jgi:DNA processing protein
VRSLPRENPLLSSALELTSCTQEKQIALGGTLITEFPAETSPAPQNFLIRNRIIRGMSAGVLVVEAVGYSGTRIPSRLAREQNRDVYAVPGNVTNKNSWGRNTVIKQGAKLVATWKMSRKSFPLTFELPLVPRRMNLPNQKPHLYSRTRRQRRMKKRS